jgi:cysteinyl-tRNA synthetase
MKYLGETFDIHGGGRDLAFPHHENEIAQSEGATGKEPFARYWIHNGFVNINAEKMSKSLGNFRSIPSILEQWDPEIVRYFLLSAHYASPIDFTDEAMGNAKDALTRFYESQLKLEQSPRGKYQSIFTQTAFTFQSLFDDAMSDDFNTSEVFGRLFALVRKLNRKLDQGVYFTDEAKSAFFEDTHKLSDVLGVFGSVPSDFLSRLKTKGLQTASISEAEIEKRLEDRKTARKAKDFKRSDAIRDELAVKGVQIKDNPDGTTSWEIKT